MSISRAKGSNHLAVRGQERVTGRHNTRILEGRLSIKANFPPPKYRVNFLKG